jgi:hypothetical protein
MKISRHPTKELPKTPASTDPAESRRDGVQGEGNYESARAFNEAERKFVESGKVPAAACAAAPKSEAEQQELLAAEQEGMRRATE